MREIEICDVTLKELDVLKKLPHTFRQRIEIAKLLDRLGVTVVEATGIEDLKPDSLRIKSIASSLKNSILAVPVSLSEESVETTYAAMKEAKHPRLQVVAGLSPARMEYVYHQKQPKMLETVKAVVSKARELTEDVEFVAEDATRAERTFLYEAIKTAVDSGAGIITIYDRAGNMLPDEFFEFIETLKKDVPELSKVRLGIACDNTLHLASSCALKAMEAGADILKAAAYALNTVSLSSITDILKEKGEGIGLHTKVETTSLKRVIEQIKWIAEGSGAGAAFNEANEDDSENTKMELSANEDMASVMKAVERLGYDLSEEDKALVFKAFTEIAKNKEVITSRELDAIVASAALQVPPTYTLVSYVINSGNLIKASSHMTLEKNGTVLDSICLGDGPIDASFKAIEAIAGRHFELYDFEIQSIAEGHEAMGETIVKLMSDGKIYSGRGISTDVIGSGIRAYINALNKIVYEEEGGATE